MTVALLVMGLNHRTAPVEIREKISFSKSELEEACRKIALLPSITEAVVLSTCNRTEIIVGQTEIQKTKEMLLNFLIEQKKVKKEEIQPYFYFYSSLKAVDHIFRVVCGLDSMVLGETQITGQLKESYQVALKAGTCKEILNPLFQQALKTVKIVRTKTGISYSSLSVGYAAVELARKILGELKGKTGLLIGAGEMSELAFSHLKKHGIENIFVINRTSLRAKELARRFDGRAFSWEELPSALRESDVVISSTGSPAPIISESLIRNIMKERRWKPMFLIDIAVPRDIQEEVAGIPDVYLYDIDDLKEVVEANLKERKKEASKAEAIIEEQVTRFNLWLNQRELNPVIRSLKQKAEKIRRMELEKSLRKVEKAGDKEKHEMERLSSAIVNKILHEPIINLKKLSEDESKKKKYIKAIKDFFNLE